jgi:hypothetical protein
LVRRHRRRTQTRCFTFTQMWQRSCEFLDQTSRPTTWSTLQRRKTHAPRHPLLQDLVVFSQATVALDCYSTSTCQKTVPLSCACACKRTTWSSATITPRCTLASRRHRRRLRCLLLQVRCRRPHLLHHQPHHRHRRILIAFASTRRCQTWHTAARFCKPPVYGTTMRPTQSVRHVLSVLPSLPLRRLLV